MRPGLRFNAALGALATSRCPFPFHPDPVVMPPRIRNLEAFVMKAIAEARCGGASNNWVQQSARSG
jgi:hypothetical protein